MVLVVGEQLLIMKNKLEQKKTFHNKLETERGAIDSQIDSYKGKLSNASVNYLEQLKKELCWLDLSTLDEMHRSEERLIRQILMPRKYLVLILLFLSITIQQLIVVIQEK